MPPPYVPQLSGEGDTSCFDKEFTDEPPNITQIKMKPNQVKQCETGFPEFSFTAKSFWKYISTKYCNNCFHEAILKAGTFSTNLTNVDPSKALDLLKFPNLSSGEEIIMSNV